jgi:hypothetical protein
MQNGESEGDESDASCGVEEVVEAEAVLAN